MASWNPRVLIGHPLVGSDCACLHPEHPGAPPIPITAGVLWALLALFLVRRWSTGTEWPDMHRWALVFSAILVCMLGGFAGSSVWPRIDLVGKAILNVIAVVCLLTLARRLRNSQSP